MFPILLVDDSKEDLLLAERVIRQAKVLNPLLSFRGADECIAYFENPANHRVPVLLFLDLVMFPKNGLDVLNAVQSNLLFQRSLTVMLTGLSDVRYIQQGYQAGAATFLIKPFSLDDLVKFLAAFQKHFVIDERPEGNFLHWFGAARQSRPEPPIQTSFESSFPRRESHFDKESAEDEGN